MTDNRTNEQIVAEAICGRRYRSGTPGYLASTDNPTDYGDARSVLTALEAAGRLIDEQKVRDSIARAALVAAAGAAPQAESGDHMKKSDLMGRFAFDGAEGIAFWIGDSDTEPITKVMFDELETLKAFIEHNLPGMFGAAEPDAATDGRLSQAELEDIAETHAFCADRLFIETELVDEIRAERDAALAAVERVRAIHKVKHGEKPVWALGGIQGIHKPTRFEKYSMCEGCSATWPCPTVAALDGAPEPEWEWGYAGEAQVEAAAKAIADCHNPGMFEKYPENWRVEARAALVAAQGVLLAEDVRVLAEAEVRKTSAEGNPVSEPGVTKDIAFVRGAVFGAAQGAAPQAPAINANCTVDADGCEAGTAPQGEGEERRKFFAEYGRGTAHPSMEAAPVHPSSIVDEGNIAEVIGEHRHAYSYTTGRGSRYVGCACGDRPEKLGSPDDTWLVRHQARAVVEAIGGESR